MNERVQFIPKVEYVDGPPEVSFIPIDEAIVGGILSFFCIWFNVSMLVPVALVGGIILYRKFKEGKPKNFYQTIPYEWGIYDVKGMPPVVVEEFME